MTGYTVTAGISINGDPTDDRDEAQAVVSALGLSNLQADLIPVSGVWMVDLSPEQADHLESTGYLRLAVTMGDGNEWAVEVEMP